MGRRHLDAIARIPQIEPLAIHGAGLASALRDPEIDAVDLCLPTDLHASVAIEALRAGKHVLVEKPMALDAASCHRIIAEAAKCDRILMVAHVLRFSPAYLALEKALPAETVRSASLRRQCGRPDWAAWFEDAARTGGGVFDLLVHDTDMALHLFGSPQAISASGAGDLICAKLHYAGGLAVEISGGWHTPSIPFSMEYTVVTDRTTVHYDSREAEERGDPYAVETRLLFAECVRRCYQAALAVPAPRIGGSGATDARPDRRPRTERRKNFHGNRSNVLG